MQDYRPDIDGLRAVAVVPVVLYHAGVPALTGGFVGVDVFFVISGYLITGIVAAGIAAGSFSIVEFYERRARRILPALFVVLAASVAAGWWLLLPEPLERFAKSLLAATLFGSNFWFLDSARDYFAPGSDFAPLLHTWSLAVEEQFYLFFPPLLWAVARWRRGREVRLVAWLSLASFLGAVVVVAVDPPLAFYLAPLRIWELGLGALLALRPVPRLAARWQREGLGGLGLAGIAVAVFGYDDLTPFPGLAALAPCLGALAIIAVGSGGSLVNRALAIRPIVFVGLISYSLYLWHWPILAFLRVRLGEVALPAGVAALAVLAALGLAAGSWRFVEQPFRRRPPAGWSARAIFRLSGAGMGAATAVSIALWAGQGAPSRLPAAAQAAYASATAPLGVERVCVDGERHGRWCAPEGEPGAGGAASFLLWGDSHARTLLPGVLSALGGEAHRGVYSFRSACPPVLDVVRLDKGTSTRCAEHNDAILAALEARPDVPSVILAARWPVYAEGARTPAEGKPPVVLIRRGGEERLDPANNFGVLQTALAGTVERIVATGRDVVIIGPVPEVAWNVRDRVVDHYRWGTKLPPGPSDSEVRGRQGRVVEFLEQLAEHPRVRFVPLASRLCAPDCPLVHARKPLYSDSHHLSRYGSELLIGELFREAVWGAPGAGAVSPRPRGPSAASAR